MKRSFFVIFIFLFALNFLANSQAKTTVEEYISVYKDLAINEMKNYHIPASITLAQGILESENGNSELAQKANNHFGIKCHKEWTGKTFHQDDDEKDECFRKYPNPGDSYRDHSEFLSTRDRYKFLFDLDITDYNGWAYGLRQAGYATNPRYPELLIRIIEENELYKFDKGGSQQSAVSSQNSDLHPGPAKIFEITGRGGNDRVIFINNGVKFVISREGDNEFKIAAEFGIYSWQITEYNDLSKQDELIPGQKVYLERKKRKAQTDYHIVQSGDNLHSISQDYGIRIKSICRLNSMKKDAKPADGAKLRLR